jgi:hypothetical protein
MIVKVNALREVQSATREELSLLLRSGDAARSALLPYSTGTSSVLDRTFKAEFSHCTE